MHGKPVARPENAIVLRPHWQYQIKRDGTRRSRNCCDGSPRSAPAMKGIASTYSSCVALNNLHNGCFSLWQLQWDARYMAAMQLMHMHIHHLQTILLLYLLMMHIASREAKQTQQESAGISEFHHE